MLTKNDFLELINSKYNLSQDAIAYLTFCLLLGPSRRVGAHAKTNVVSWKISNKTNQTVSTESHTAEMAFLILSDYDLRILGVFEQLEPINIERTNKRGKISKGAYTADFLSFSNSEAVVVEVKTEEEIESLISHSHSDWIKLEDGSVEYLPAKIAFSNLGLRHEVFVYSDKQRYLIANTELMLWSRENSCDIESLVKKVNKAFEKHFIWSLDELCRELSIIDMAPIIKMIDRKLLFANLNDELISYTKSFFVTLDERLLEEAKIIRDKRKVYMDGQNEETSLIRIPSHDAAENALTKIKRIESGEKSRSTRRWMSLIREGEKLGLNQFQSLISRRSFSGNKVKKINNVVDKFLVKYLWEEFVPKREVSFYAGHADYLNEAEKAHPSFEPVSRITFTARFRSFPEDKVKYIRGGKRAGNAASEPSDPNKRSLKPQLAWQKVSIDHCLAKIYLIYFTPDGVPYAMRPWITAMIDMATSRVLAISISFDSPSRHSVAKIMRECVRRHGKLPREIIVDRGSDFTSVYFSSLLAHYSITLSLRPPAHSRYGSEVEGFFGEFRSQWLTLRPGNLTDFKEARKVDGDKTPKNMAVLRPYDFLREINAFCEWRDNKCRGFSSETAAYTFKQSEQSFPFLAIPIEYSHEFLITTAIEQRTYTLDMQRGLHIGDFWYWHPKLSYYRGLKKDVEVRLDPENPHVVYARVDNKWVTCSNAHINSFSAKDPISQLVDGLIYSETANQRRKIKLEATRELTRMAREMDKIANSENGIPIVSVDLADPKDTENVSSIFDAIKNENITTVNLEYWSA